MKGSLLFFTLFSYSASAFSANKPNILWLTSEDHGIEMGCYGDSIAITPNIDALAAKGMIFKVAWSNAPVSAAARTAIISGMYPSSTGSEHMRSMQAMPEGTHMYPYFLKKAGYYCSNNSKEDYNLLKTNDLWDESSPQAHWKNRSMNQPFFAIFNSTKSHESQIRKRPHRQVIDPANVRIPAFHPDTPEIRQDWAQYYDCVSMADADAGLRLKELEEAGLTEETIIFYYGDHGTGMPGGKRWPSNLGLRVPVVVYFPEKWRHLAPKEYQSGGVSERLISFVDLAPTLLSIAGISPPSWMQGYAFAGKYQSKPKKYLHGLRGRMDECTDLVRSVTDGRYVYLRNYMPHLSKGQHVSYQFETPSTRIWKELFDEGKTNPAQSNFWTIPKAPEELYDLQSDPDEVINLAYSEKHKEILMKFRKVQYKHALKIKDTGFLPEGEVHSRSHGASPYDMARAGNNYPLKRIMKAADIASFLDPEALPRLQKMLNDDDNAVRYWAISGIFMRGKNAVNASKDLLQAALEDKSAYVRIAAAQALAKYGTETDFQDCTSILVELAPADIHGVFISMSALMALRDLNIESAAQLAVIRNISTTGPSPHDRYNSYIPRLVKEILESSAK